jgi:hypothetical protein
VGTVGRTSYTARAKQLGLLLEYKSLQGLRRGDSLADPERLLDLAPRLRDALSLSDPLAPNQLAQAKSSIIHFLVNQPEQDRLLGVTSWNIKEPSMDGLIPPPLHSDGDDWLDRCQKAADDSRMEWTNESTVRRQSDRLTFNLLVYLLSRAPTPATPIKEEQPKVPVVELILTTSPKEYKDLILSVEASATRIDRLPKRISTIFKDEDVVREIAIKRFVRVSPNIDHYVLEHTQRRELVYSGLRTGLVIREIYNWDELLQYCLSGMHGLNVSIERSSIVRTIENWLTLLENAEGYHVALTDDPLPFKYEVIDDRLVVLHEAVGRADSHRLNAICVSSTQAAAKFLQDFEIIWERIPAEKRTGEVVADLIRSNLLPAATRRKE